MLLIFHNFINKRYRYILQDGNNYMRKNALMSAIAFFFFLFAEELIVGAADKEGIANHVYAGVNGNGDVKSGDGWKYRGGGLIHELGHQVGMVPDGDSSKMSKLDKGIYHYTHTHVGDHCYNGCSSTEDLKSISALRNSVCVMF